MRTITELQTNVAANTVDGDYPASNTLTAVSAERYQNTSGDNTATLTVTVAAGGANVFGVSYTNATSIVWALKDNLGATVESGTINLTSPRSVDRCWQAFTAQAAACTIELAMTAPSGSTLYVGIVRSGVTASIALAIEAIREILIDNSIRVSLAAPGAEYVELQRMLRGFVLTLKENQSAWYSLRTLYMANGPKPLFMLLSDEFGSAENNEWCVFGKIDMPPESNRQRGGDIVITQIDIKEAG